MLNLDTHILIFALRGELRPHEQALLTRGRWSVSAIVFWEMVAGSSFNSVASRWTSRTGKSPAF